MAALPDSRAVGHAAVRTGDVIVLEREPGHLGAATASAAEAGLDVLFARPEERDRAVPFGVARQLFAPALARLDAADRAAVLSGPASMAEPVFTGDRPADLETLHGLYWLATHLADRQPIAIVVDAAENADEPSMRLCRFLAERIDELPVALVMARRPQRVSP